MRKSVLLTLSLFCNTFSYSFGENNRLLNTTQNQKLSGDELDSLENTDLDFPLSPKIVGGTVTNRTAWPSVLNLQTESRGLICGANYLGNFKGSNGNRTTSWVLTAAHCCDPLLRNITVSTFPQNSPDFVFQVASLGPGFVWKAQVLRNYVHPKYSPATMEFDFCLCELQQALTMKKGFLEQAQLAPANYSVAGQNLNGVVVGWGLTSETSTQTSPVLRQVTMPILNSATCNATYASKDIIITKNMICAGVKAGGLDACSGDSGGGLFVKVKDAYITLGINSFGIGCGLPNLPGVYGLVSAVRPWIDQYLVKC